ncbi:mutS protein homolog 5 isoform X2 [Tribolium castaneum]|uniref:MutS protein homolog 5-like Protein n=1 Tax=Tribolium castaneum TaxID=7070 RepID=D6X337_TRICA|nr:PREDICTED: mutS protein homolog 5 isoform X2 [Tribolium castaneum]EFA10321.2 MutS protein homolog 5-like Protein [Tribolium castaneum]|eukprot:XP_008197936.1 PREDICTED: mutS protein homolog 5 isoform X2 [Tribolium castaneum]
MVVSDESELIFTIRNNATKIVTPDDSDDVENDTGDDETKILSLVWKNGKLGAAYFNFNEKLLYVYEEVLDLAPLFYMTCAIYREVAPKFVITVGNMNEEYVKHVIDVVTSVSEETTTTDTVRTLPPNMFLLRCKEYSFEICRSLLCDLRLISASEMSEAEGEIHINSLLNFDYKCSVHAAGALVKYLDKTWAHFLPNKDELQFLQVTQVSLRGHLLIDWTTLKALQIFQQCSHDASFKRGLQSSNREGLSVYRLFSSSCKSKLGQICLKNILHKPLNDIHEISKRLDFVTFVLHPSNQDFVESLQDNIRNLSDVSIILLKIKNSRATCRDWRILYKSIYHTVFLRELTAPYQDACELLSEFYNSVTMELLGLENSMNNAIDFSDSKNSSRPVIKTGFDESLDAKKLRRQDIAQHVRAAAGVAAEQLPDYLNECSIVYLPEMGHLVAINEWKPNCDPEELKDLGFQFMFTLRGTIHYKNPLCLELDENLGDINAEIIAHENRILQRLSSFILKYNKDIREPLRVLSLFDALIAIAKVSAQNNYVRPALNNQNMHEIRECRHPLLELVSNFEPNDFCSGNHHSHIKIITGPNGSGKSVYLKEVALVIYFAHIGSYVPARSANIGILHCIHSRMQATESAAVRLSAFMIDAIQATQAIHNARHNSLILLDEFGRGTTVEDGLALLVGFLADFHKQGNNCPHILVSTHHQSISDFLPEDGVVEYLKMAHSEENGTLLFLYKVAKGVSRSFAIKIAAEVGVDASIIKRANELFEKKKTVTPLVRCESYPASVNDSALIAFLKDVNIPEPDEA